MHCLPPSNRRALSVITGATSEVEFYLSHVCKTAADKLILVFSEPQESMVKKKTRYPPFYVTFSAGALLISSE